MVAWLASCTGTDGQVPIAGDPPPTAGVLVTVPPVDRSSLLVEPQMPNAASADIVRQQRLYDQPDPLGPLQRELGVAPVMLPPGTHTTDVLGIEVTLELDDWWRLDAEETGSFLLNRPDAPIAGLLPALVFLRPVALAPPARVADWRLIRGDHNVAPDDLGAWLDEVEQIDVLDRGSFTVGDRVGEWFDIDVLDDRGPLLDDCVPGRCLLTWWSGGTRATVARDLESLRYYTFPDPLGPIYVLVAASDDEFDAWNERVTEVLGSVTFGPSAPHPTPPGVSMGVQRVHEPGAPWRFVGLPGVEIVAQRWSVSVQVPGQVQYQPYRLLAENVRASLVRPVSTFDGEPLESASDVVAVLDETDLERIDDDVVHGRPVPVFEGTLTGPIFRRAPIRDGDNPDFVRVPELEHVRVWVVDGPEHPLLVVAESEASDRLSDAVAQAELLIDSFEFT